MRTPIAFRVAAVLTLATGLTAVGAGAAYASNADGLPCFAAPGVEILCTDTLPDVPTPPVVASQPDQGPAPQPSASDPQGSGTQAPPDTSGSGTPANGTPAGGASDPGATAPSTETSSGGPAAGGGSSGAPASGTTTGSAASGGSSSSGAPSSGSPSSSGASSAGGGGSSSGTSSKSSVSPGASSKASSSSGASSRSSSSSANTTVTAAPAVPVAPSGPALTQAQSIAGKVAVKEAKSTLPTTVEPNTRLLAGNTSSEGSLIPSPDDSGLLALIIGMGALSAGCAVAAGVLRRRAGPRHLA